MSCRGWVLLTLLLLLGTPALADVHPNTAPGFPVDQSFHVGDIDNVNLFNGGLTLTIPLGRSYPVGGGFSYSLKLVYNSQPWTFYTIPVIHPQTGEPMGSHNLANANECDNAGLGWRVSLGRMNPPCQDPESVGPVPIYQDENGTDHMFYSTLHYGNPGDPEDVNPAGVTDVQYTRDGSYLRLKVYSAGYREIEFPDGTIRRFRSDGLPTEIRDPFSNKLSISYPTNQPTNPWVLTDSQNRTHTVHFRTIGDFTVVDHVDLAAFNGGDPAVYTFQYTEQDVGLACPHNEAAGGSSALVPLLTGVFLPDGSSYQAPVSDYITAVSANGTLCTDAGGYLTGLRLPTLGKLEWTWQKYLFPSGSAQKPRLQTNDGVLTRTMRDGSGTVLGTWTYHWATIPTTPLTAKEHTTTVTDPLGYMTVHYFSVATDSTSTGGWSKFDYSLPFTWYQPLAGVPGMNLSREVYAAGTRLRSEYVQYERDPFHGNSPPQSTHTNRRLVRNRTVYHDDGDGNIWAGTLSSNFDGLGHYRQQQTEGSFPAGSNARTRFGNYNPARGTYVVNLLANTGSGYSVFPASSRWVLEAPAYASETEGTQTAQTDFCYAPDSATVTRRRVHRQNGSTADPKDFVTVHDLDGDGNVMAEKSYGGDVQGGIGSGDLCTLALPASPEYQINHAWAFGVKATSQYSGTSFTILSQMIDPSTGLVSSSTDSAGLQTRFEYDKLGRMTWSKPDQGHGGWTQYIYAPAGAQPATVTVRRRDNGSEGATVRALEFYLFDSFGRIWKEQRQLPTGTSTRETIYDGAGNKATVSEMASSSSPSNKILFLSYDPFGRPGTIRPPDGASHDVTLTYQGVRQVSRTVKIATNAGGGETSSTTTEIYDRFGRLISVAEPSGSGGAAVTTSYGYDVGNRLTSVSTPPQSRSFTYDRAGLLQSETHPEKGASGNGAVSYPQYDSRGHARRKTDGPNDLVFTYDAAERLSQVKEQGSNRLLKSFSYAGANGTNDWSRGKLRDAFRYNYVNVGGGDFEIQVKETYTYGGRDGRVSKRDTAFYVDGPTTPLELHEQFSQGFTYNTLGLVDTLSYPACTHAGCTPAAPVFADVPAGHPAQREIEAIYKAGVTAGCNTSPRLYCPDSTMKRSEMAVFLIRAVSGETYTPPPATCSPLVFQDVPCTYWAAPWIEELYRRGLTAGCATSPARLYCPESTVNKAEMSVFLLRNREGLSYQPPPCTFSPYSDAPCGYWATPWILEAKRRGIIPECSSTSFCSEFPPITRAQIAGYLARGFDFPVAIPPDTQRTVNFAYTQGLLTGVSANNVSYGTLSYHPNLLVSQINHTNGMVETQSNDPNQMRRPSALAASGPYASWSSGTYAYDGAGNVKSIGTASFTYDKVNRLVTANLFDGPTGGGNLKQQSYAFDAFGNITSITTNGVLINTPTSTGTNRLTGSVTYDAAGNLTGRNGAIYQYDRFNQMKRMASGSEDWAYIYTADDERIWSFSPGLSRWTLRDLDGKVLREYLTDSRGWSVGTDHVYRDGLLLAAETQTGRSHFHLDHLGTPRLITRASGDRAAYHVYYPFGEEATAFNQDSERMKFTGHERDLGSAAGAGDDLDYMHARHCSPVTARFLAIDRVRGRVRAPQSWNRYAYTRGNPLKYVDPDGLDIKLSTENNSADLRTFLVRTIMRPSGRANIMKLAKDSNFTTTFKDVRINSPAMLRAHQAGKSGSGPTAGDTNPYTVKIDGVENRGAIVRIDTVAVQQAHPDRTGVSTTAHESTHAVGAQSGLSDDQLAAQDKPTNDKGEAEQFGKKVSAEQPDMTQEEAETLLDELLKGRPPQ